MTSVEYQKPDIEAVSEQVMKCLDNFLKKYKDEVIYVRPREGRDRF